MKKELIEGNFGIEKETLRVSRNGEVVSTDHPFGGANSKFKNPHITVDFSEQQVEVITGVQPTIDKALEEIELLTNIVYRGMNKNEYLWNYSIPYGSIENATPAKGQCEATKYREGLLSRSTINMQLISGVHFNFSFRDEFTKDKSDEEINNLYFKIVRNYARVSFVTRQMFGMSPTKDFKTMDKISHRQSKEDGYHNSDNELSCFCDQHSYDEYINFIDSKIKEGSVQSYREVYTNARLKPLGAKRVQWIEARNIDLDFTQDYAINVENLKFIHKFLMYLAFADTNIPEEMHDEDQATFDFKDTITVLEDMRKWLILEGLETSFVDRYINKFKDGKFNAQEVPSVEKIVQKQVDLKERISGIPLKPIDDMELSTQILIEEAYKDGLNVQIIDHKSNKVKLNGTEIEMATLNPFDSKDGLDIIDSKIKTNEFLKVNGYGSTQQSIYKDTESVLNDFESLPKKLVIKPVNTNFSKGLSVFENGYTKEDIKKAADFALSFDETFLVEQFVSGQEYRFLVIDSKIIGVLKRVPANVIGNGKNSIKELIDIKNQNKLRGVGYKLPLEKIKLTEIEIDYLAKQGLNPNSVVSKDKMIFLRKNSNVSTGGDTYDVTDLVNEKYKTIAIEATDKLGLKVCGLDIIIPDIESFGSYTILEMNWNPAIHIHTYPLIGQNRHPAKAMVELVRKYNAK